MCMDLSAQEQHRFTNSHPSLLSFPKENHTKLKLEFISAAKASESH